MDYKADFPIFQQHPNLVYLDSAATTQKPQCVIDAIRFFLENDNAPIERGLYPLALNASQAVGDARLKVAQFLNCRPQELVFTANASASLNLLAESLGALWKLDPEKGSPLPRIILSKAEHHSNLLPWWRLAEAGVIAIDYLPLTEAGELDLSQLTSLLTPETKLIALAHINNVTGALLPLKTIQEKLKKQGSQAQICLDVSQSVARLPLSIPDLGVDYLFFSSHKVYGPNGVGVLWGRSSLLEALPVVHPGGGTVEAAKSPNELVWKPVPHRLEVGTPASEGIIGLSAATNYLEQIGMTKVAGHNQTLHRLALQALQEIPTLQIVGQPASESGIISFNLEGIHPHDLAEILGKQEICLRAGQHCASPLHQTLQIPATARISLGIYNQATDIEKLVEGIRLAQSVLQ